MPFLAKDDRTAIARNDPGFVAVKNRPQAAASQCKRDIDSGNIEKGRGQIDQAHRPGPQPLPLDPVK